MEQAPVVGVLSRLESGAVRWAPDGSVRLASYDPPEATSITSVGAHRPAINPQPSAAPWSLEHRGMRFC